VGDEEDFFDEGGIPVASAGAAPPQAAGGSPQYGGFGYTPPVLTNPPRQARPVGGPAGKKGVFTVSRPAPAPAPALRRGASQSLRSDALIDDISSAHSGSTRGTGGREYGVIYFELVTVVRINIDTPLFTPLDAE